MFARKSSNTGSVPGLDRLEYLCSTIMAPIINNPPKTLAVIPRVSLKMILYGQELQGRKSNLVGENVYYTLLLICCRSRFYSNVVECLPVNPVTGVGCPAGTGWNIFALQRKTGINLQPRQHYNPFWISSMWH